jgi:hypothetical protein
MGEGQKGLKQIEKPPLPRAVLTIPPINLRLRSPPSLNTPRS